MKTNIEWLLKREIIAKLPPNTSVVTDEHGYVMIDFGDGEMVSIEKLINLEAVKCPG